MHAFFLRVVNWGELMNVLFELKIANFRYSWKRVQISKFLWIRGEMIVIWYDTQIPFNLLLWQLICPWLLHFKSKKNVLLLHKGEDT